MSLVAWQSSPCPYSRTWLLTKGIQIKNVWNVLDIWALELRNMVPVRDVNLGIIIQGSQIFFIWCSILISIIRDPLLFQYVSYPKDFENAQWMFTYLINLSWLSLSSAVSFLQTAELFLCRSPFFPSSPAIHRLVLLSSMSSVPSSSSPNWS